MRSIDACPGRFDRSTPILVRESPGGEAKLLVLLDGVGSWGSGAEAAERGRQALAERATLPSRFDHRHLISILVAAFRSVPAEWDEWGGWDFSIAAAVIRGASVTVVASGDLAVVLKSPGVPPATILAPERLVDRLVREGRLSASEADKHPLATVIASPFFDGRAKSLQTRSLSVRPGDSLLLGCAALSSQPLEDDDLERSTARDLRDRLEALGGPSRPTAIVRW